MRHGIVIVALGMALVSGCGPDGDPSGEPAKHTSARHAASVDAAGHQHGTEVFELGSATLTGIRYRVQRLDPIRRGTAVGFAVHSDTVTDGSPVWIQLIAADGSPAGDRVRVPLTRGAGHAHLTLRADRTEPSHLVISTGDDPSTPGVRLDLQGRVVDLHAGHHHGVVARFTGQSESGWLELKLHDDKGDLELWLYRDLKSATPLDVPLDTAVHAAFPELGRTVTLAVRNRETNEDEDGKPHVRDGKTDYFIFPGRSGQDPTPFVGRAFCSPVKITCTVDGRALATESFLLVPHSHGPGGHGHDHGNEQGHGHDHGDEHGHDHGHDHATEPGEGGQVRAHDHAHDAVHENPAAKGNSRRALVVDTDLGLDDVRALFALLTADTIELAGVISAEGSASLGKATDNLTGLLESTGQVHVPVVAGVAVTGQAAPPWRATANGLAGNPFPPPRGLLSVKPSACRYLERITHAPSGPVEVLALGPLANLASFLAAAPDRAARLATVWIPVERTGEDGRRIRAWNLSWNAEAARTVLEKAPQVVLVDVRPARGLDLDTWLADTPDRGTPALRWIHEVQAATGKSGGHRFVYDELAVFAVANPDALRISEETYQVTVMNADGGELVRAENGNVRLATIRDPKQAMAWLKKRWAEKPDAHHAGHAHAHDHAAGHDHAHAPGLPPGLSAESYLRTFHGHLGPFVVIGYRMGRHALSLTGSDGHFGIRAHVHTGDRPPRSCLIDGVQLGAGCTLGKRNIRLTPETGPSWVEFTGPDRKVVLKLRPQVPGLVKKLVEEQGVEAAGRHFLNAPLETWLLVAP